LSLSEIHCVFGDPSRSKTPPLHRGGNSDPGNDLLLSIAYPLWEGQGLDINHIALPFGMLVFEPNSHHEQLPNDLSDFLEADRREGEVNTGPAICGVDGSS
jgi:hypothetical protein